MVCTKNKNSIRGKRYRLRIETSQILAFNFSKSKAAIRRNNMKGQSHFDPVLKLIVT